MPFLFWGWLILAQVPLSTGSRASAGPTKEEFSEAIEDNSFFIEEAYNQERRVVQHISEVFYFPRPDKSLVFNFTQEWPIFGLKHQFSYTILYSDLEAAEISGLNDILFNYRYQLFDHEDWAAVAPRLSIVLPTGNSRRGLGSGVVGIQANVPVSKRISEHFVAHGNIGLTYLPSAKGYDVQNRLVRQDLFSPFGGASIIFLAHPNYNFLLEFLIVGTAEITDQGASKRRSETVLSPGFRCAINVGRLQIVPGLAIPVDWTGKETRVGIFLYLSFEHPY